MSIHIEMTAADKFLAAQVGLERTTCKDRTDKYSPKSYIERIKDDQIGVFGEIAVARHFNIYWNGGIRDGNRRYDVGPFQVRSTPLLHGNLVLKKEDRPDDRYILTRLHDTPKKLEVEIVGWAYGKEAQREEYWGSLVLGRPEVFLMPAETLHTDLNSLKPVVEEWERRRWYAA